MLPFVHSLCPCRKVQIEKLVGLFGEKGEIAYPAIFVYGHTGTGKSHVLRSLMNNLKVSPSLLIIKHQFNTQHIGKSALLHTRVM